LIDCLCAVGLKLPTNVAKYIRIAGVFSFIEDIFNLSDETGYVSVN